MKLIHYTAALLAAASLIFAIEVQAKQHGSKQARERVLKQISGKGKGSAKVKKT